MSVKGLGEFGHFRDEIINLWGTNEYVTKVELARTLLGPKADEGAVDRLRKYISRTIDIEFRDKEVVVESVRLAKSRQKLMDQNRIQNKTFREHARVENAIEEFAKEIAAQNREFGKDLKKYNLKLPVRPKGGVGVIHLTDLHGNELIDSPHNKYDFEVLSKRLKKHISESIAYFKYKQVEKVLIAFTGDLLNSDRRLDEILSAATNRSKATVMMIHLLKQAILDVRQYYPVTIVSVLGNESRVDKEMTFSSTALSNNYDFAILAQLHQMFEFAGIKDVTFGNYDNTEEIIKIENQKWLLAHNLSRFLDSQEKTQAAMGRYSLAGHQLDFCIGGHIHATRITDISARSSSMAGSNAYNEIALNLMGRAQQNCYVVKNNERSVQVNDLQDTTGITGYEISKGLQAYNAKSVDKTRSKRTILTIQTTI
jgi:hypothetical protein